MGRQAPEARAGVAAGYQFGADGPMPGQVRPAVANCAISALDIKPVRANLVAWRTTRVDAEAQTSQRDRYWVLRCGRVESPGPSTHEQSTPRRGVPPDAGRAVPCGQPRCPRSRRTPPVLSRSKSDLRARSKTARAAVQVRRDEEARSTINRRGPSALWDTAPGSETRTPNENAYAWPIRGRTALAPCAHRPRWSPLASPSRGRRSSAPPSAARRGGPGARSRSGSPRAAADCGLPASRCRSR